MHAFLIVGENTEKNIKSLINKLRAKPIEFTVNKIEDIRNLNSFTSLSVTTPQAIILKNIENSTPEALNALLKNLEEPAEHIYYILTCQNLSQILPTIKSRCQVIRVSGFDFPVSNNSEPGEFMKLKISQKFSYLDKIKIREEALSFVKNLIVFLHPNLITNTQNMNNIKNIKICQQVFNNLKANGNINIQLTYLAINQI